MSLQLRKMLHTHWDGGCPFCDQEASVMGYHHCGGGNATGGRKLVLQIPSTAFFLLVFTGPAVFLEASTTLPLPGSVGMGGARETSDFMAPCVTAVLFKASQPPLSGSTTMGRGKGRCLSPEKHCFCPSYSTGRSEHYNLTSPLLPHSLEPW